MKLIHAVQLGLVGCTLGLLAAEMTASAAPSAHEPSTPNIYRAITSPEGERCDYLSDWSHGLPAVQNPSPAALPRLTVADFMGTWKVYAKCGEDVIPSINLIYRNMIGKTIVLTKTKAIDHTGGMMIALPELSGARKPFYSVEYKIFRKDTPYPDVQPPHYQYPVPGKYSITYFKIGYYSKIEKKITYSRLYVGSNHKNLLFALTLDAGDTDFYLCKLNPKTGHCQDHP